MLADLKFCPAVNNRVKSWVHLCALCVPVFCAR